MMRVGSPLLVTGLAYESSLDGMTASQHRAMPVTTSGLAAGMHLFVAADNGSAAAYLGKVTSEDGLYAYFERPAPFSVSSGYRLLAAVSAWQAVSVPGTGGMETSYESGLETLDTTGGELLHTRVRDEREFVELTLRHVNWTDYQAYKAFLVEELAGGLKRFVAVYRDEDAGVERCDVVKLRNPGAALQARYDARVLRTWVLELQVVQRNLFGWVS